MNPVFAQAPPVVSPAAPIYDFILTFSSVLWEAIPFVVLGAVLAGILEEVLPQQLITRFLPKAVLPAVMIGGVLGLVFPMCECGILVVMRRLLRKGLPLSCCVAYMLAGPIVNVVVLFSTWVAFVAHGVGTEMVLMRAGFGFLTAVVTGLVVQRQYDRHGNKLLTATAAPPPLPALETADPAAPPPGEGDPEDVPGPHKKSLWHRLNNISSTAIHDFVDISVFLIIGAVLAATAKQYIHPNDVGEFSKSQPYLAIPAMMLLAVLMCLCSEADAFVAASFTTMHLSAKLAFLVLGPMLDLKLLAMYTRVFRPRLIATIVVCVVAQVLVYGLIVHAAYSALGLPGMRSG